MYVVNLSIFINYYIVIERSQLRQKCFLQKIAIENISSGWACDYWTACLVFTDSLKLN